MAFILVADDDEIIREVAADAFRQYGHRVISVENGADALRAVHAKSPDAVVMDCNMPEMTGVNALTALRTDEKFFRLPVIMLTGRTSDRDRSIAEFAGANAYVTKPFDPDMLVFTVEHEIATAQQFLRQAS